MAEIKSAPDAAGHADVGPVALATAFYSHPDCRAHEMGFGHPEAPERLLAIDRAVDALTAGDGEGASIERREAPLADDADLLRIHPQPYLDALESRSPKRGYALLDADTLMNPFSLRAARRAAGAAVAATDAVIGREIKNAFCSVRPPGHHAGGSEARGFCIFHNVAVAARRALEVHRLDRVAVVDFDVHHGNGTEEIFSGAGDQNRVLMVSFFQHPFYPYSGTDHPAANMVNVPLPAGSGGPRVRSVVESRWIPALDAFKPQMIFISAGFDAHRDDPLAQMRLVEDDYVWLTRRIMEVAERYAHGRIVSCLEGGYDLRALGSSVAAHVKTLAAR